VCVLVRAFVRVSWIPDDMPGSGWSEESAKQEYFLGEQVSLTEKVMEEMGEEGPFVMMGSMDSAYDRALNFALFHEEKVVAVVPVALLLNEFQVGHLSRRFPSWILSEITICRSPSTTSLCWFGVFGVFGL
jgi:hypothetical protein